MLSMRLSRFVSGARSLAVTLGVSLMLLAAISVPGGSVTYVSHPAVDIPDGDLSGIADTIQVTAPFASIASVQVTLEIEGGYNGDYYVYLRNESGGFAVLLNSIGRTLGTPSGSLDAGLLVTLRDEVGLGDIHGADAGGGPLSGLWQPDGRNVSPFMVLDTDPRTALLDAFTGQDPNGEWTLFVADLAVVGTGSLTEWSLTLNGPVLLVPEAGNVTCGFVVATLIVASARRQARRPVATAAR